MQPSGCGGAGVGFRAGSHPRFFLKLLRAERAGRGMAARNLGGGWWMRVSLGVLSLLLWSVFARPAAADISSGPVVSFPIVSSGGGSSFSTLWYIPDPSNTFCASGQYYVSTYTGGVIYDRFTLGSSACYDGTNQPMYSLWLSSMSVRGTGTTVLPQAFTCPAGSVFDNSSMNCLTNLTNTADTVAGWVWGFGCIAICTVFGGLFGAMVGFLEGLGDV